MYTTIDRPARNRRTFPQQGDDALELQLMATLLTGRAIQVPLAEFHSSPAKGRIYLKGYRVRHRVLPDKQSVGAWVEEKNGD